jgi:hypothetical protein
VVISGQNGDAFDIDKYSGKEIQFYPLGKPDIIPEKVPERAKKDYLEATQVISFSAKAAAALCRRCVHTMVVDFIMGDETEENDEMRTAKKIRLEGNFADAIKEVRDMLDKGNGDKCRYITNDFVEELEGIRHLGNKSAHESKTSSIIYDDEENAKDKVQDMLDFTEEIFEQWYVKRFQAQRVRNSLIENAKKIKEQDGHERAIVKQARADSKKK